MARQLQVLQGRSEPPRHSKQPSQPSSHPPSPTPARDMSCCWVTQPQQVASFKANSSM